MGEKRIFMKNNTVFFMAPFLFLWIIFSSGSANAQETKLFSKALIEQTTVEFSPVIAGSDVVHVFQIHNKGNATLNIPGIYTE
jgi:hypothetical protein